MARAFRRTPRLAGRPPIHLGRRTLAPVQRMGARLSSRRRRRGCHRWSGAGRRPVTGTSDRISGVHSRDRGVLRSEPGQGIGARPAPNTSSAQVWFSSSAITMTSAGPVDGVAEPRPRRRRCRDRWRRRRRRRPREGSDAADAERSRPSPPTARRGTSGHDGDQGQSAPAEPDHDRLTRTLGTATAAGPCRGRRRRRGRARRA